MIFVLDLWKLKIEKKKKEKNYLTIKFLNLYMFILLYSIGLLLLFWLISSLVHWFLCSPTIMIQSTPYLLVIMKNQMLI